MEIQEILRRLEFYDDSCPREAIEQAILQREEIIPELLRILEYVKVNAEDLWKQEQGRKEDYYAHIYAMYLLAQFREKRAYPLIVDFFSIPGDLSVNLTDDVATGSLGNILASVSCGDTSLMAKLAENYEVNEFVRGSALEGFLTLVVCGEKSREEVISYYKTLFRGKLEREWSQVWNALVYSTTKLYPEELYEDIKLACEEELVDPFYMEDIVRLDDTLKIGKEKTLELLQEDRFKLIR